MLLLSSEMSVGGSFTFVIEIVNCLSNESAPLSVERTQTVYELFTSKLKLAADCSLSLLPPPIWNELLSGNGPPPQPVFSSVYVCVSPASGSVVVSVPTSVPDGWFSAIELDESWMSVGAWFAVTVNGRR